jgi:hypothetical protein
MDAIDRFCKKHDLTREQATGKQKIPGDFTCDTLPKGCVLDVEGNMDLRALTTLNKGVSLTSGGDMDLRALTTIHEGVSLTSGGYMDLTSVTTLPKGVSLTSGGNMYLPSVTTLNKGVSLTSGRSLYCPLDIQAEKLVGPVIWPGEKYVCADGILMEVVSHKGKVWKGYRVGTKDLLYLVVNGASCSHGKTLKEARESLVFKASQRDVSEFKSLQLSSKLEFKDAIACYRSITGACATGVQMFAKELGLKHKAYTVREIIKLTEGRYGHDQFKAFFQH